MAVTLISSFSTRSLPSGTVTFQSPFSSALPVTFVPSGSSTVTSEPGVALPLISLSPAFGFSTVGVAVWSCVLAVAVAVIVALSAVIAVPGFVDHFGFSYPSFAVTVGYLSAGNFVPSFTSYTLLFAMSFTPSSALNVTLTYPAGVGLSSSPVLSMMSSNFATLIGAFTLSVVPSEYFTTTGIFTVCPASASAGV